MINKIIIIFGSFVLLKVLYNAYYYLLAKNFLKKYEEYITNQKSWYITENRQRIVHVFKKANIIDNSFPNVQLVGYGYVRTGSISMFDNISSLRKDVVECVFTGFKEAKAVFKNRIIEAFNPIYWVELIIYLPKNILTYLGITGGSLIVKISQIIWWSLGLLGAIVGIFFNKEFMGWIQKYLR